MQGDVGSPYGTVGYMQRRRIGWICASISRMPYAGHNVLTWRGAAGETFCAQNKFCLVLVSLAASVSRQPKTESVWKWAAHV